MLRLTSLRLRPTRSLRTCIPPRTRSFVSTSLRRFPRVTPTPPADTKKLLETVPSFQEQVARTAQPKSFSEEVRPSVMKQVLFFVFGSSIAFSAAATITDIDTDRWLKGLMVSQVWSGRVPTNDEIRRTRYFELAKKLQGRVTELKDATDGLPLAVRNLILMSFVNVAQSYLDMTDTKRMCWKICALNGAIWLAWKLPRLRSVMAASFMHHPRSGLSYTLLTSMFSHKGIVHLLFNCMALSSFGPVAAHFMAREQANSPTQLREASPKWHFLAFFISAGLFSGLVSHIASATIRYPRLLSQIASSEAIAATAVTTTAAKAAIPKTLDILPSLGASGAIYAAATLTALGFPSMEIALIFPPSSPFPIQYGMGAMVFIDMMGVLRGWRFMDHWAHLGGAAFGALYYAYGPQLWDIMRVTPLRFAN